MKINKILALSLALLAFTSIAKADNCDPNDPNYDAGSCVALGGTPGVPGSATQGGGNSGPGAPEGAPIDGGASIMIAAGVAYGVKKLRGRFAKKTVKA